MTENTKLYGTKDAKYSTLPTKKAEWVREDDVCISPISGVTGKVLRVVASYGSSHCRVRWDNNGHVGAVTITTLRRFEGPDSERTPKGRPVDRLV